LSLTKRRSRIVSFRLSQEEYESLKAISATRGARSVSEFTRSVACSNAVPSASDSEAIEEALRRINEKVDTINDELRKLHKAYEEWEKEEMVAEPAVPARRKQAI